jgi:methyl-accepting chemotaxis protein
LVAGATVIAALVGILSIRSLSGTINAFGDRTLPAMLASQRMLDASSQLVAATRDLAKAPDDGQRQKLYATATRHLAGLNQALDEVRRQQDDAPAVSHDGSSDEPRKTIARIVPVLTTFAKNLDDVNDGSTALIAASSKLASLISGANAAHDQALSTAAPLIRGFKVALSVRIGGMAGATRMSEVLDVVDSLDEKEISWLTTAQSLQTNVSGLQALLTAAGAAASREALAPLQTQIGITVRLLAQLKALPANQNTNAFGQAAEKLISFTTGSNDIAGARIVELDARSAVDKALTENGEIARTLSDAVRDLADSQGRTVRSSIGATSRRIESDLWLFVSLAASSVLVAVLVGWLYVSRSLMARIFRLRDCMLAISSGKLDTVVPADGQDEIAAMGKALTVFKDNALAMEALRHDQETERQAAETKRRRELVEVAEALEANAGPLLAKVADAAENLRRTASALSKTADDANDHSQAVASSSSEATGNVQTVSAAAEELSASVREVARQASQSAKLAQEGGAEAAGTERLVASLQDASARVGTVLELITAIARKTQMLALNATIEASRAGEAGRGFAVVASEVKALADQTKQATDQIGALISSMQGASNGSSTAISKIAAIIVKLHEIGSSVSAAVTEQSSATDEIVRNVGRAAQEITNVDHGIAVVLHSAADTQAASSDVLVSADDLAGNAQKLKTEVEQVLLRIRSA